VLFRSDGALRHVSSVIERALAEQVPAERNGDGGKVEAAVAESSSPGHRSRPDHRTCTPIADHPGAGAAGGIGMALLECCTPIFARVSTW